MARAVVTQSRLRLLWTCAYTDQVAVAPFYDVGAAYLDGHILGSTAHALGVGLRLDVSLVSFIWSALTLRFDIARTVNDSTPLQYWLASNIPSDRLSPRRIFLAPL